MNRILIVEDDSSIRKALTMGLTSKKYEVDNAKDGFTGILKGTSKKYDVLVTDLCLPDYNGIEVIGKIKESTPDIVPIVITGRGSMESTIEAIRLEVADYLEKPVSLRTVENAIVQGLKKRSMKQEEMKKQLAMMRDQYNKNDLAKNIPGVVHQINNPLAVINAAVLLAKRSIDDKKKLEQHLSTILRASQKIAVINTGIMNFGKTLGGKRKLLKAKPFFNDCLSIFKGLISLNAIEMKANFDNLESIVILEPYKLEQIFSNLLLNAMDAMDGCKSKRLDITSSCNKKAGTWSMDIQDSGCGISNNDLNKVFLPYFTTKSHGTGLGLSVVRQMLKSLGGEIKIKSMPGQGSTVTMTLPLNGKN